MGTGSPAAVAFGGALHARPSPLGLPMTPPLSGPSDCDNFNYPPPYHGYEVAGYTAPSPGLYPEPAVAQHVAYERDSHSYAPVNTI